LDLHEPVVGIGTTKQTESARHVEESQEKPKKHIFPQVIKNKAIS
jgi:hypothetical protein